MGEILANLEDLALEDDEALYCTLPVHLRGNKGCEGHGYVGGIKRGTGFS